MSTRINATPVPERAVAGAAPEVAIEMALWDLAGNKAPSTREFTVRLRFPNGYRIAPHTHPTDENVTVISGTFNIAMGEKFDDSKGPGLKTGSFAKAPPPRSAGSVCASRESIKRLIMSPGE